MTHTQLKKSATFGILLAIVATALNTSANAATLGGQHSVLSAPVVLNSSNTWQTLNFDTAPLNTPGGAQNVAWDDGLYLVSGTLSHPLTHGNVALRHLVSRLTVDGTPVTTSIQGNTVYGGNRMYHVGQLSAGDALAFQFRTPAGVSIVPAADWHSGTVNVLGGPNLANAQSSTLGGQVALSNSNLWTTLPLTNVALNTPGSTMNEIWSDGIYIIKGHITSLGLSNGVNSHIVSRLTVNGVPVEKSIQGNTTYSGNSLSHVGQFSAGDTVALQYRTPAIGVVVDPAADWQSAGLSLVELKAVEAQRSELGGVITLSNSNLWTDLPLTNTTLNTPGTTPHTAWDDGLYLITGSLAGFNNNSHIVTRLLVNGTVVEESIQGDTVYGTNLMEHLTELTKGDIISFQYRTPQVGLVFNPAVDWQMASLSLVRFQEATAPEPSAFLLAMFGLLSLGMTRRGRSR